MPTFSKDRCAQNHPPERVHIAYWVEREGALLLVRSGAPGSVEAQAWRLPQCLGAEQQSIGDQLTIEAGIDVTAIHLADVFPTGNDLLLVYSAEVAGETAVPMPSHGCQAGFFRADRMPTSLSTGGHACAIRAWQSLAWDRWVPGTPLRFCPNCARRLQERHVSGRNRPACRHCGFVHFQDPKVGVSVLLERDGDVLLVQRGIEPGLGQWSLPSGFMDWDEAPKDALIRELAEETGLAPCAPALVDVLHYRDDFRGPGISLVYVATAAQGVLAPGDDAQAAAFFAPGTLPPAEQIAFAGHRDVLRRWCEGKYRLGANRLRL